MAHTLLVEGPSACFRRPEIAFDSISYDVMTPMAARGIFETVHRSPAIRWQIERIVVQREIRITSEVYDIQREQPAVDVTERHRFRHVYLADVRYMIRARFEMTAAAGPTDNPGQHADMFRRRAKGQRFFRPPFLGRRDLIAQVRPGDDDTVVETAYAGRGAVDLGWMVYDRHPDRDRGLLFFRPTMVDGVIDLTRVGGGDLVG